MCGPAATGDTPVMDTNSLMQFSDQLADVVDHASPSVVQVHGRRRPASGVVFAPEAVVTMIRGIGRGRDARVRAADGRTLEAEVAGWDPATRLAVLRVPGLDVAPARPAPGAPRVGHLGIAVARSWSNAVTASVGTVAVVGGPLPTGPGLSVERIIRTTAFTHQGFAGGAFTSVTGDVVGLTTAFEIRGLSVVLPAEVVWKSAADVLANGHVRRGYLGLAGQPVRLTARQRGTDGPEAALLVLAVTPDGPADRAGLLVGDLVTGCDGQPVDSPERLLDLLSADRVGRAVALGVLRGMQPVELSATVGERHAG